MKKILSLILSVLLAVVPITVVAADGTTEIFCTTPENDTYGVTVTVKADVDGAMTAQVVNSENNVFYGWNTVYEPVEADGIYTYTFNFRMPKSAASGTYRVYVGNNVATEYKDFSYVNISDKNVFLNGLDAEPEATIKVFLDTNYEKSIVDLTEYNLLSDDILPLVNSKIAELSIATGYDEITNENEAAAIAAIQEKETYFKTEFESIMKTALLADVKEGWAAKAEEALGDGTFDAHFYDEATAQNLVLNVANVAPYHKKEVKTVTTLDLEAYKTAFDRATVLYVEGNGDYTALKTVFMYYVNKGVITPSSMTKINSLVASGNDSQLWKDLLLEENTDCTVLAANAVRIASAIPNVSTPQGGGGGAGGGMSSTDKPVTPGPSMGSAVVENESGTNVDTFNDIGNILWAKESIEALTKLGVISGRGDGSFAPDDSVKREEFIKMLVLAFQLYADDASSDFSDVDKSRWSYTYISSAYRLELIQGSGADFNPDAGITREDMAVIVYRLFLLLDTQVSGEAMKFSDGAQVSEYARDAVSALSGAGIINGMGDGTFAPKATVTRAQSAKIVYELLRLNGGAE